MTATLFSFVIPARNEARYIGQCITAINALADKFTREIIIVDNGSTDDTPNIARSMGATVISKTTGTIGSLRNEGARRAEGQILIFIDADVVITPEWQRNIETALTRLQSNARHITGSHCFAPDSDPAVFRTWFNSFASESNSRHLGTGHLIINRNFFEQIGGFSETLQTGEDYEFCVRANAAGADIQNDTRLAVLHLDFPKTIQSFFKREMWHGRGDLQSWQAALQSRVVNAAVVFLALHFLLLGSLLSGSGKAPLLTFLALIAMLLLSSLKKFRHRSWKDIASNACVFYVYYWGRIFSARHLLG